MPTHNDLDAAIDAHAAAARGAAGGTVSLDDLMTAAQRVADEARVAALRATDDGWATSIRPSQALARRIIEAREYRKWSQARLGEEMAALGFGWKRLTVVEVERGARPDDDEVSTQARDRTSRRVSLDEMLGLAALFEVSVVDLLRPPDQVWVDLGDSEIPPAEVSTLIGVSASQEAIASAAKAVASLLRTATAARVNGDST